MKYLTKAAKGMFKAIMISPVKVVCYEVGRIAIVAMLTKITKSTKNDLDDKIIKPIIDALKAKTKDA
jgi:hypothetical protein